MWASSFQRLRVLLPWVYLSEVTPGCGGVQHCHPDPLQDQSTPSSSSSRWGAQSWAPWPEPNHFLIPSRKKSTGPPFSENTSKFCSALVADGLPPAQALLLGLVYTTVQFRAFSMQQIWAPSCPSKQVLKRALLTQGMPSQRCMNCQRNLSSLSPHFLCSFSLKQMAGLDFLRCAASKAWRTLTLLTEHPWAFPLTEHPWAFPSLSEQAETSEHVVMAHYCPAIFI